MPIATEDVFPRAEDCKRRLAELEGERASELARVEAVKAAEKQGLLDQFAKPSGVSDEERLRRAASIIKRAVESGLTSVEVGRFPVELCTDRARAINQQEKGWEETFTGLPKELVDFWRTHRNLAATNSRAEIVSWPAECRERSGSFLAWD